MQDARPRFSAFTYVYAIVFLVAVLTAPFVAALLIGRDHPLPPTAWADAAALSCAIGLLLSYASFRCSSDKLTYREGMLFVATSMRTGWLYSSMFCVLPALLVAFVSSVALSLYYEAMFKPKLAAYRFHQLVAVFHRHRMRQ